MLIVLGNLRQQRKIRIDHDRIEEIEAVEEDKQPDKPRKLGLRHLRGEPNHQETENHWQRTQQHKRKAPAHALAADVVAPVCDHRVRDAVNNATKQRRRADQRSGEYGVASVAGHKQ